MCPGPRCSGTSPSRTASGSTTSSSRSPSRSAPASARTRRFVSCGRTPPRPGGRHERGDVRTRAYRLAEALSGETDPVAVRASLAGLTPLEANRVVRAAAALRARTVTVH
ncbi:conserved hypothetical protein [Methylorubrum extorquens AM1]|uniref:Uncharacterized protein n=1 Tax=Methylorubrum extorquens (strain ATCC 14718 / DSM 1338 / JCM 2805 / NCIMB 9133 / AM1) TaxID=272630 RepID=C5AZU0_METEA|nr:conserved hypothetical protein [Methylorubrum extorquens AM1]